MKNENKNTYKNVLITSLIAAILITSGIGVAYAADNEFSGTLVAGNISYNNASGGNSAAFGGHTTSSGNYAAAFGDGTIASGINSAAFGAYTTSSGEHSAAFGAYTAAQPYSSFVVGRYNEISGSATSWIATDPLFVIGTGVSAASPNNAVTVLKNGNVGIGISAPTQPLQVAGIIESTFGGFKFPDGTTQATASNGELVDETVTTAKLADNSVTSEKIAIDAVTNGKISANVVTERELADDAITTAKLADHSVTTDKMADVVVTTAKIADGAITTSKISSPTLGGLVCDIDQVAIWTGMQWQCDYIQLDTSSGLPTTTDCDDTDELGRMKVDDRNRNVYVCVTMQGNLSWRIL